MYLIGILILFNNHKLKNHFNLFKEKIMHKIFKFLFLVLFNNFSNFKADTIKVGVLPSFGDDGYQKPL